MAISCSLYLILAVLTLAVLYLRIFYRKLRPGEPPIAPGHFLWGNGRQFEEHAVQFLHSARKICGDIFTVRFLNQYWTMILDIHSYSKFAKEKNFSFEVIQKQVNANVFSYSLVDARKMIGEAKQKVNGKNLNLSLDNFAHNLRTAFDKTAKEIQEAKTSEVMFSSTVGNIYEIRDSKDLKSDDWSEDNLRNLASRTFFSAVFYSIFGRGEPGVPEGNFHPQVFHKTFDQFHKYFNYLWLGLPAKLFPEAIDAFGILSQQPSSADMINREGCSEYIKFATEFMLKNQQSESDIRNHNLVFLHVNYNSFRAVYWCMYHLMENRKVMEEVRREVDEIVESKRSVGSKNDNDVEFTAKDINRLPIVDSFLKEIIRFYSGVFMVRHCIADTQFETEDGRMFNIRKGDKVAIYPPAFHFDEEIYEQPQTFKHDRFVDATFYKGGKEVKHPLIGFGSLCPGEKLAMLQIKWFIINIVNSFKLELFEGERTAADTRKYGHEILPPTNDVMCRFKVRENSCQLTFINSDSFT